MSRIVSITNSSDQLGRDEIAIVTSLLENQTDIAAGNATVSNQMFDAIDNVLKAPMNSLQSSQEQFNTSGR